MRYTTALNASFAIALLLMAASGPIHGQNSVGEMERAYVNALPDGPGKAEMVRVCGGCHGIDEIGVVALSRGGWQEKIDEMFRNGAVGTDQEVELALSYLARTFPARLDINRANTMDFRRYVGLSERDGDAIVAYRQRHGRFSRWQDLERVPGINFKKVRERSEILVVDPEP